MKFVAISVIAIFVVFVAPNISHALEISNSHELEGGERYNYWVENSKMPIPDLTIKVIEYKDRFQAFPKYFKFYIGDWNYVFDEYQQYSRRDKLLFKLLFHHELGHIWDLSPGQNISRSYRKDFMKIMNYKPIKNRKWKKCYTSAKGCEQFTEGYAYCSLWPKKLSPYRFPTYGYHPSLKQHKKVCKLIRNATI